MLRSARRGRTACCAFARTITAGFVLALPATVPAALVKDHLYGVKALGGSEAVAVGSFGSVYRTSDGGKTWDPKSTGVTQTLFSVDFAGPKVGWAVGKSAVILKTNDTADTWTRQPSPIPSEKHLFKVAAIDERTAWAVGDWGAITTTRDGGATWEDRSLGKGLTIRQEDTGGGRVTNTITDDVILYDLTFPSVTHGYICGEFGTVLATRDGGSTWQRLETGTGKTLFGIGFKNANEGWVVGMDGLLLRTVDGGQTWVVQHGRTDAGALEEVGFLETLKNPGLYAVRVIGQYGLVVGDVGLVLSTKDGGATWIRLELPDESRLLWVRDVSLAPDANGFLVGANGLSAIVRRDQVQLPTGAIARSLGAP